jgi:hypothetical protein
MWGVRLCCRKYGGLLWRKSPLLLLGFVQLVVRKSVDYQVRINASLDEAGQLVCVMAKSF